MAPGFADQCAVGPTNYNFAKNGSTDLFILQDIQNIIDVS